MTTPRDLAIETLCDSVSKQFLCTIARDLPEVKIAMLEWAEIVYDAIESIQKIGK